MCCSCRTPIQNSAMFYVMYLGYVCLATVCGFVLFLVTFKKIVEECRKDGSRTNVDHILTLMVVHGLLGATWVLGVLTARHGGLCLNVAFCVVNGLFGLAVLVRCTFDFRLRSLCADLSLDAAGEGDPSRRRRRGSQDTWSHDSSPGALGRTAASLMRDDSRDVFAGNSIITPAPQNGNGWRRLRRGEVDRTTAASLKYGKPEVSPPHGASQNDVRTDGRTETAANQINTGQFDNVATTADIANEALTYI